MPATFAILEETFLSLGAVELGRFITNVKQPHLNYFQPTDLGEPEELTRGGRNVEQGSSNDATSSFIAELTRILSSSLSKEGKTAGNLKIRRYKIHEMANTKNWFKAAVKQENTRKWLEETIADGDDIYLVTGYLTVEDANVEQHGSKKGKIAIEATAPLGEAVRATTGVSPGEAADVQISGQGEISRNIDAKFTAQREQICSVQFQKVMFRWYSSRNVEKAFLEREAIWKAYRGFRGEDSADQLDVVEAVLDETGLEDIGGPFEEVDNKRFYI